MADRARFYDVIESIHPDSGAFQPIQNPVVTLYEPGTTTPLGQTIYAAHTGGTTLANPLTGDSDGTVEFYLTSPQSVKMVVAGAGFGTVTLDWAPVIPSSLIGRDFVANDTTWALTFQQDDASGKMLRVVDPDGNTALRLQRSTGGRNVLWLLEPAIDAANTEESLLVVSATATTLVKMVALGLTVNGGGVDVGPLSSIVSRSTGALSHIRAAEFHTMLQTGATAGPSWGIEVGGHYQVAGPTADYNVGVNIQSWLFGLASGVAGNSALWMGGALGWDEFVHAAHTDGTVRWKLDSAGKITGGSISPRTDSTYVIGSSVADSFLAVYSDYLVATVVGAANSPSITWGTDTDTGLFDEPGVIGFTTDGTERARLSSAGWQLAVQSILPQISTPSAPASGTALYSKTGGGLYSRAASGSEKQHKADGQYGFASGSTSSPTTTSASYADLEQMSVTLTTTGGDLLVDFLGAFTHSDATKAIVVALSLDAAAEVFALAISVPVAAEAFVIPLMARFTSVSAGTPHTVKVRWLTDGATATANGTDRYLRVQELPH